MMARVTQTFTPSSVLSNTGGWSNPGNVYSSNDAYATNAGAVVDTEYPFELGGFDFTALPADAWIESITVSVEAKSTSTAVVQNMQVQVYDGATLLGIFPFAGIVQTVDKSYTFTLTATYAQLKSANLRAVVTCKRTSASLATLSVDAVGITVIFVPATGTPRVGLVVGLGSGGSVVAVSVTAPVGVRAGDLLVAVIGGYAQTATSGRWALSSLPAGFTLAGGTMSAPTCFIGDNAGADRTGYTIATKVADGTETTLTVTWVSATNATAQRVFALVAYRGMRLLEAVNSSNTANTASTAGAIPATSGAVGLSVGAESTALVSGSIDDATSSVGDVWYVLRQHLNSGAPSLAIADFLMTNGTTLPVADWTWTGSGNGALGKRGTSTILIGTAAPAGASVKVWSGSAWVDAPVKTWDGGAWVAATAVKTWNGSAWV